MSDPDVIVVGAGPAGMVLSLLLSRSGIKVVALEQARAFAREFRGELLQAGAVRIFEDLGLRERILSLGNELPTGITAEVEHTHFAFEFPAPNGRLALGVAVVPQRELLELPRILRTDGAELTRV